MTSPLTAVVMEYYGGAASRVAEGATAFPHRQAQYNLVILSQWADPAENERHIEWTRGTWRAMQAFSSGRVYVNALGEDDRDRVREAFGPNYARLAALKSKYDPTNFFRLNQNIVPTG